MSKNNTDSNKKCIWSKYECINDFMDRDFVCSYYRGQFCYSDESCVHYESEERKESDLKWAYQIGDRIHYHSFGDLRRSALVLSSVGYGVAVLGLDGLHENILTIMALPERKEK